MASFTSIAAGDGNVFFDSGTTWALTHDATNGNGAVANGTAANIYGAQFGANNYGVGRIFIPFDTSSLTGTASAASGSVQFSINTDLVGASSTIHVVKTTQALATGLGTTDFQQIGTLSGGSVAVSGTGTFTIALNSTGLGWINNIGTSFIGLREDHDLRNTTPTTDNRFAIVMADNASLKPTLTLTTVLAVGNASGFPSGAMQTLFGNTV